jgi:hypothetical protein
MPQDAVVNTRRGLCGQAGASDVPESDDLFITVIKRGPFGRICTFRNGEGIFVECGHSGVVVLSCYWH